jgi:uncharacterized membrane protein
MKINWNHIIILIIIILIIITLFVYSYNDEVEKEYFDNYLKIDEVIRNM